MKTVMNSTRVLGGLCLLLCSAACGGRPAEWDTPYEPANKPVELGDPTGDLQVRGLTGSVALLDPNRNEVMMLTSPERFALSSTRLPVGQDVLQFKASVDRDKLFVLSRGVKERFKDSDEAPQLRIFDGGTEPHQLSQFGLQDPYNELEVDPFGEWLVVRGSEGLVSNPNELVLVKVPHGTGSSEKPFLKTKTLDSSGGKPIRLRFTSKLSIPGNTARRLLIVEREHDLAVIDLEDLDAPEITVGMPLLPGGDLAKPVDVSFHDAVEGEVNPLLAVRLDSYSNVMLLSINESTSPDHAFSLDANEVDVGGPPTQLDFVQTRADGGLRLAALVPGKQEAKLIDPSSGALQTVSLGAPFSQIRRITGEVTDGPGQDIALLYGETTHTIAFWRLGATTGTPYRSIDLYQLGINVSQVLDIPTTDSQQFADRKILSGASTGNGQQFYVLDLADRKSFPLDALSNLTLNLSPTGTQLWAFSKTDGFAQLTFDQLRPASLYAQASISFVHDIATQQGSDERSAIALHILPSQQHSSVAATLYDGLQPSTAQTKFFPNIELMGIHE